MGGGSRRGRPSGGTGYSRSARSCSGTRLVASTFSPGAAPSRSPTDGSRLDQVLEVVQHQQQLLVGQEALRAAPPAGRLPLRARRGRRRWRTGPARGRSAARAERRRRRRRSRRAARRRLAGQPRLARAAGTGQGQQLDLRHGAAASTTSPDLSLATEERGGLAAAGCSAGLQRLEGREVVGQVGMQQLKDVLRLQQIAQPVLAQVAQLGSPQAARRGSVAGRSGRGGSARHGRPPAAARAG